MVLGKCTEIGIDEITPLLCDHSERKVIKEERLEKVIISAMKQSLKAYLPRLNPMIEFSRFVKNNQNSLKCIAHCMKEIKSHSKRFIPPVKTPRFLSAQREISRETKSR